MDDLFKTDPIKDSFKFHKKRLPQHVLGHMSMLQYILYMEHHLTTTINPLYNSLLKTIRFILMILLMGEFHPGLKLSPDRRDEISIPAMHKWGENFSPG